VPGGEAAFDARPNAIRHLGPWTGGAEGEVDRLRLPYRLMLGEQGFVIIHQHVSKLELEAHGVRAQANPNAHNVRARGACPCARAQGQGMPALCRPRLGIARDASARSGHQSSMGERIVNSWSAAGG